MVKITTNIVKGFISRLQRKDVSKRKKHLKWLQEKMIKHQEDKEIKNLKIQSTIIYYKRPYELLHTYKEIFENGLYQFHTASPTPLIIDCGSNIGISVLYFKQLYPEAQLIVFEPDESNFNLLTKNIQANRLTNVTLNKAAVWTQNGFITFEASESEASRIAEANESNTSQVESFRLADLINSKERIDFLKIDIEGAEYEVLIDIADGLHKVQNLFLEYHGKTTETYKLKDIFSILKEAGFDVYIRNAADNLQLPFIEKKTGTIYDVQLNIFCYRTT